MAQAQYNQLRALQILQNAAEKDPEMSDESSSSVIDDNDIDENYNSEEYEELDPGLLATQISEEDLTTSESEVSVAVDDDSDAACPFLDNEAVEHCNLESSEDEISSEDAEQDEVQSSDTEKPKVKRRKMKLVSDSSDSE